MHFLDAHEVQVGRVQEPMVDVETQTQKTVQFSEPLDAITGEPIRRKKKQIGEPIPERADITAMPSLKHIDGKKKILRGKQVAVEQHKDDCGEDLSSIAALTEVSRDDASQSGDDTSSSAISDNDNDFDVEAFSVWWLDSNINGRGTTSTFHFHSIWFLLFEPPQPQGHF